MKNKEIVEYIDYVIKDIWQSEIKYDYENKLLLKEDTLKNAMYFHLRTKLQKLIEENNIRIYTEFTDCEFEGEKLRPDIVIVKIDPDRDVSYLGNAVIETLAVIEIKYKARFDDYKKVLEDYDKLSKYIDLIGSECKLYMATIWENEDDQVTWIRKNAAWAKGRVIELNASFKRDGNFTPQFYICEH